MDTKAPKQATHEAQEALQDLTNNAKTEILLSTGRKVRVGWLCADAQDKIDDIIVHHDTVAKQVEKEEISVNKGNKQTRKFYSKMAAAILLNSYFRLKFFFGIKWRIIHHFWHLNGEDYLKIIAEGKKKAAEQPFYLAMAYSTTMSDIWTTMTKKEAEVFRREVNSASERLR